MSSQNTITKKDQPLAELPAYPVRYLSSEGHDWDGLVVHAYHEPLELEGWIEPAVPGISLVLLSRGSMYLEQRQGQGEWKGLSAQQGDLFLNSGQNSPAELRWKALSAEPLQTIQLQLDKNLIARTAEEVLGYDLAKVALREHAGFQDPLVAQIGLALCGELEQPSPGGKLYAQTAAQLLAVHLLRHYSSIKKETIDLKESSARLTRQQVLRVSDFMRHHLNEDLSLESLAEQTGLSAYHFARLFRQATGESPHQFVLHQRLVRAKLLLKDSDLPLAEIALEVGFANQSHFSRVFKNYLGLTPRAYRQQY